MIKLKKLKLRLYGVIALALALGVAGAFGGVKAYQSYNSPKVVIENVENYNEAPTSDFSVVDSEDEPSFGAVSGPDLPNPNCQNDLCTEIVSQVFKDVTNTVIAIPSPFLKVTSTGEGSEVVLEHKGGVAWTSATATMNLALVNISSPATTTYTINCGVANSSTTAPVTSILLSGNILTSSVGVVQNNVTAGAGAIVDGGTSSTLMIGSQNPWIVCKLAPFAVNGIINGSNTLEGKAYFRLFKQR